MSADQLGFFEPRFGADFSKVRVHQGARAARAARSVGARAYALGHDIAFGEGEYHPDTPSGRRLLAHELTHVLQQAGNGGLMHSPMQIQRSPLENCTDAQVETINGALSRALLDLDIAISLLEPRPLSRRAQDAMWLTFRDTDDLKTFIATEYLRMIKDRLPVQQIECEQVPYHLDDCKEGAGAGTTNSGLGHTYLCMGYWDNSSEDRERTLIHEVVHRFIFRGGDPGYFDKVCGATGQTMRLSIAQRFRNADSYSCLAYLLARETAEGLRSRVLQEKGEPPPTRDKIVATVAFGTNSNEPDEAALATLASQLASHQENLNFDEYHIGFDGYASRTGDDDYNQMLSEQRAQAVKVRLESLLGTALGNPGFKFAPTQTTVEGHGEERAREAGKPTNDDSASDRVVDVVFAAM